MDLKGSKTEENLRTHYIKELQAYAKYNYFASAAREEGFDQIADVFFQTAKNEAEHAEHELKLLGEAGNIRENLKLSITGEHNESRNLYPEAAKVAGEEGFTEIAEFFRKMSGVERKHEEKFRELLDSLDKGDSLEGKTARRSSVYMAQVMLPDQANSSGNVHGGELMKLMDSAAGVVAVRHSSLNSVTAMVEEINFHHPVRIGELVLIHAQLTFASYSSMEILVNVETENLSTGKKIKALSAHFVMVALDSNRKPKKVPPLSVCTEEEERLFNEGLMRYKSRRSKAQNSKKI